MSPNVPESINRKILEQALAELRTWRRLAITAHSQSTDEQARLRWAAQADHAEVAAYAIEALLHPAGGDQ